MQINKKGILYVVATPIGNLQDITFRALETLKNATRIIVEDTRHAKQLLNHFGISKPLIALHDFNETKKLQSVLNYLEAGEFLALITDAGTPLISDPGFPLVRAAKEKFISVVPIPGPSAIITALSAAGLPTDKFVFEGFLPAKAEARVSALKDLRYESRTIIFYEAPHRLLVSLSDMREVFGDDRQVVVARELTKIHESIRLDNLKNISLYYQSDKSLQRGESVILLAGVNKKMLNSSEIHHEMVLNVLLDELPLKQAVTLTHKITGKRKNELYELALGRKNETL